MVSQQEGTFVTTAWRDKMSLNTLNYGNCNKVIRDGCPIEYV